jgi:hypothetical protein
VKWWTALLAAGFILLPGCADDETARRLETLHVMDEEMSDEERVAFCDGYAFDADGTYHGFTSRWESIFTNLKPPNREVFDSWMMNVVCVDEALFPGVVKV